MSSVDFNNIDPDLLVSKALQAGAAFGSTKTGATEITDKLAASEEVAALAGSNSAVPILPKPTVEALIMLVETSSNDIKNAILDGWLNNLAENKKRIEDDLKKAIIDPLSYYNNASPEYRIKMANSTAEDIRNSPDYNNYVTRLESAISTNNAIINGLTAAIQSEDPALKQGVGMAAAFYVVGVDSINSRLTVPELDASSMPGTVYENLVEKSAVGVIPDSSIVAAIGGLLGGLWMAPLLQLAELISKNSGKDPIPKDLKFAMAYDTLIRNLVSTAQVDTWMRGMVLGHLPKLNLTPEQASAMAKTILLASALILYYRVKYQNMTGPEFRSMLEGTMDFSTITGNLKPEYTEAGHKAEKELVNLIQQQLKLLTPEQAENLKTALANFADSNPSLDSLVKPRTMLSSVLSEMETLSAGDLAPLKT